MTGNIFLSLAHLFDTSRRSNWPLMARIGKAQEELGEVATAGLVDEGFMTHKKLKEPFEGEIADTFICIFDALCKRHQEKSFSEILELLAYQIDLKKDKWRQIVDDRSQELRIASDTQT
jgi:5-methylcytosine-specific restriction endonuclease McrBC GTP-binding regulatory subunit McrB